MRIDYEKTFNYFFLSMLWSGLLILSFIGCGWISNQTGDGSADSTVTTTDEGDAVLAININDDFSYTFPQESPLAGTGVLIPSGTLSVSNAITLSQGGDMSGIAALDFDEINSAESASQAVSISAEDEDIRLGNTITLTLPLNTGNLNLSSNDQLAVIYVRRTADSLLTGLIAQDDFKSYTTKTVSINVSYWGTYQVIKVPSDVNIQAIEEKAEESGLTLSGSWKTSCHGDDHSDSQNDSGYYIDMLDIQGSSVAYRGVSYNLNDCSSGSESLEILVKGSFVTRESVYSDEYSEVDILIAKLLVKPISSTIVNDFNRRKVCGYSDWQSNKIVSVDNCNELDAPLPGEMIKEIFYADDKYLIFGESTDSHDVRPYSLEIDADAHFYRQGKNDL